MMSASAVTTPSVRFEAMYVNPSFRSPKMPPSEVFLRVAPPSKRINIVVIVTRTYTLAVMM